MHTCVALHTYISINICITHVLHSFQTELFSCFVAFFKCSLLPTTWPITSYLLSMDEPRAISYALAFVFIGSLGSNVTHIHPSIYPSFYPSIHPSIYPPVYPSYFCLAVYLPPWWRWSLSIFRANLAEMRRHKRNL